MQQNSFMNQLHQYGAAGVSALAAATPVDTRETANSWYYEITKGDGGYTLVFRNSHVEDGQTIAVLLHYGHGTRTGGFVPGRDYINDAIQPIFDQASSDFWKGVTSA